MAKVKPNIEIVQSEEYPVPLKILADEIVKVSQAAQSILNSRLTNRAILLLIKDRTGLPMNDIDKVLCAAADLEKQFIKKGK